MKLISYTGRDTVEIDLGTAEKRALMRSGSFVRQTRGGTLYLRPGSTSIVSEDEFAAIEAMAPAIMRFISVHPVNGLVVPNVEPSSGRLPQLHGKELERTKDVPTNREPSPTKKKKGKR